MRRPTSAQLLAIGAVALLAGCSAAEPRDVIVNPTLAPFGTATVIRGDVEPARLGATFDGQQWCVDLVGHGGCTGRVDPASVDDRNGVGNVDGRGTDGGSCSHAAVWPGIEIVEVEFADGFTATVEPITPTIREREAPFHVFAWCYAESEHTRTRPEIRALDAEGEFVPWRHPA